MSYLMIRGLLDAPVVPRVQLWCLSSTTNKVKQLFFLIWRSVTLIRSVENAASSEVARSIKEFLR